MRVKITLDDPATPENELTISNCADESRVVLSFVDVEDGGEGTVIVYIEELKHALRKLSAK